MTCMSCYSASHVVLLLVKKYPQYKIVNLDRLDCKSAHASRLSVKEGDTGGTGRGHGAAVTLVSHIVDDMYL